MKRPTVQYFLHKPVPMTVIKKLRRDCATLAHYHLCDGHNNQIIKTEKAENQGDDKGTAPI